MTIRNQGKKTNSGTQTKKSKKKEQRPQSVANLVSNTWHYLRPQSVADAVAETWSYQRPQLSLMRSLIRWHVRCIPGHISDRRRSLGRSLDPVVEMLTRHGHISERMRSLYMRLLIAVADGPSATNIFATDISDRMRSQITISDRVRSLMGGRW